MDRRRRRIVWIAGLPVVPMGLDRAVERLWEDIADHTPHAYLFMNAHSSVLVRENAQYAGALDSPRSFPLADGTSVALGAIVGGVGRIPRCPGPDLFARACERASQDGTRFFLLGGDPAMPFRLPDVLRERYAGLEIVGSFQPPFGDWTTELDEAIRASVRDSAADIVWVGVSAPKQEIWAVANVAEVGVPVVCIGAAFDFASGEKDRAPSWIRAIGMEWLYRLLSEPRRLWRRYLVGNTVFLVDVLRYRLDRSLRERRENPQ